MFRHPVAVGLAMLSGGIILGAAAGYLIFYGAIVVAERPLQRWYLARNH